MSSKNSRPRRAHEISEHEFVGDNWFYASCVSVPRLTRDKLISLVQLSLALSKVVSGKSLDHYPQTRAVVVQGTKT